METILESNKEVIMEQRWRALDRVMEKSNYDVVLIYGKGIITQYGNLFYYGGYYPILRHGIVIYARGEKPVAYYNTRADYHLAKEMGTIEDVRFVGTGDVINSENDLFSEIVRSINSYKPHNTGVVGLNSHMSFEQHDFITRNINGNVTDATGMIERIKMIKTDEEIEMIRQSFALAEKSFLSFKEAIRPGRTSAEIAAEIDQIARSNGAIDTLIFVEEGAYFLRKPTPKPLSDNGLVTAYVELIDSNGYWVEKGGMFAVGNTSSKAMELANACVEAMKEAKNIIKAGVTVGEVANAIHKHTKNLDVKMGIWHGHGVGVDHDLPIIMDHSDVVLEENMVLSIHPNFSNSEETIGASLCDVFVVKKDRAESLSKLPYEIVNL
ncbi:aminopeptidase P family protein [Siminovitchia acidinfaciens]|uniref:Aminopeptidase P family protein n=1 Tax=Siminovitchia acidinfaciens TaxID=2321395 RepID=A0A429Y721_9BACI|nr:Xaa-Pro peptidase family protein [Siminovitchia acidinfaciens]RST77188.1 aminopeptidase P family protein [Siminovitchia acidinfaciens]